VLARYAADDDGVHLPDDPKKAADTVGAIIGAAETCG